MIISASRRTDIPSYYPDWFFNRIREGYALVRNPFNAGQVRRVSLAPRDVDCFVFWTKNPAPMLACLNELKEYNYYFQFTLTSYEKDVEENVPPKSKIVIPAFLKLAEKIGPERVIWRYDPVFLSPKYTLDYHLEHFEKLARRLKGHTQKCTISFMDLYRNTEKNMKELAPEPWTEEKIRAAAKGFVETAISYGLAMDTCAEGIDLSDLGIAHARCIDDRLIERICGYKPEVEKDKNQRPECGCVASVDIGCYNTCSSGCKYCYANFNADAVQKNTAQHDKNSQLLCGNAGGSDAVYEREVKSIRRGQMKLFD